MLSHFQKTDALRDAEIRASIESLRSSIKPRRTVTRRGQRVRGVFPSLKSTTRVTFESRLEYVVLSLLEAAAGVYRIESHPYVLELTRADGSTFTYTPDAELLTADGPLLCEVKGDSYLSTNAQIGRFRDITRSLRLAGIPHFTILGSDVSGHGHLADRCRQHLLQRDWPRFGARGQRTSARGSENVSTHQCLSGHVDVLINRLRTRSPDAVISAVRARKERGSC